MRSGGSVERVVRTLEERVGLIWEGIFGTPLQRKSRGVVKQLEIALRQPPASGHIREIVAFGYTDSLGDRDYPMVVRANLDDKLIRVKFNHIQHRMKRALGIGDEADLNEMHKLLLSMAVMRGGKRDE